MIPQSRPSAPSPGQLHYDFLDGVRGLAALYVVLHHAYFEVIYATARADISPALWTASRWLAFGHLSVGVFIVLSGYCLMLPVVRSSSRELAGGARGYLKRRARRILPPYYAALLLCLLLACAVPLLRGPEQTRWDYALPATAPGPVLSHLFLVHNLSPHWLFKIDPPMWSVATEWQIYFLLPWVLLPIWKRFGSAALIAVGLLLGFLPLLISAALGPKTCPSFDWACPWYVGLFSMGVAAAARRAPDRPEQDQLPWGALSAVLLAILVLLCAFKTPWGAAPDCILDLFVGAGAACLLIHCERQSRCTDRARRPLPLGLFESPAVVALGSFSYSLYLVHYPILSLLFRMLREDHLAPLPLLLAMLLAGSVVSLGAAYLFHLRFERPFLRRRPQSASGSTTSPCEPKQLFNE